MKILGREKFQRPIHLAAGDTVVVSTRDEAGVVTKLAGATITASLAMTVDEAVIFATVFEGRRALGGMVLEQKKAGD